MGGTHSAHLSNLAVQIWNWCLERWITIHAEHLPGVENVQTDWQSRHLIDLSEWKLHPDIFLSLEDLFGPFSIDLFASRTNHQLPVETRPSSCGGTHFRSHGKTTNPYMFPRFHSFPVAWEFERAQAMLIAPVWLNQLWYPQLLEFLINTYQFYYHQYKMS